MADQWNGGQSGPGERWNVNLPAVIGVVFVFLVGVIVWVVAASASDDDGALPGESVPSVPTSTIAAVTTVPTTTPLPMPSTTLVPPSAAPTVPPTVPPATTPPPTPAPTLVPPTAAPTAPPIPAPTQPSTTAAPVPTTTIAPTTTVSPGSVDLGVPGHTITQPPCNGGYITVLGSAIGSQATADSMKSVLDKYSGSNYLRTDVTCTSLTPSSNGQPIYVVYFGPYATDREAYAARTQGPADAYVRRLSNDIPPSHSVDCH